MNLQLTKGIDNLCMEDSRTEVNQLVKEVDIKILVVYILYSIKYYIILYKFIATVIPGYKFLLNLYIAL